MEIEVRYVLKEMNSLFSRSRILAILAYEQQGARFTTRMFQLKINLALVVAMLQLEIASVTTIGEYGTEIGKHQQQQQL